MSPDLITALLLGGALLFFLAYPFIWSRGGPWLPASRKDIRTMLRMAAVQPGETVYDLGCGDGRVLIIAAKEFEARAVGIEIDPLRAAWARWNVRRAGLEEQVTIIQGSFFGQDLSEADVVIAFLLQKINNKLVHKLSGELKPGTRIAALSFIFPGWEVRAKDTDAQIYLYVIPKKKTTPLT